MYLGIDELGVQVVPARDSAEAAKSIAKEPQAPYSLYQDAAACVLIWQAARLRISAGHWPVLRSRVCGMMVGAEIKLQDNAI